MKQKRLGVAAISVCLLTLGWTATTAEAVEEAVREASVANEQASKALDVAKSAVTDAQNLLEAANDSGDAAEIRAARRELNQAERGLRLAKSMAARVEAAYQRTQDAAQRAADADTDRQRQAALAVARASARRATNDAEEMRKIWLDPDGEYVETVVVATTTTTTTTTQAKHAQNEPLTVRRAGPVRIEQRTITTIIPAHEKDPTPNGEEGGAVAIF